MCQDSVLLLGTCFIIPAFRLFLRCFFVVYFQASAFQFFRTSKFSLKPTSVLHLETFSFFCTFEVNDLLPFEVIFIPLLPCTVSVKLLLLFPMFSQNCIFQNTHSMMTLILATKRALRGCSEVHFLKSHVFKTPVV